MTKKEIDKIMNERFSRVIKKLRPPKTTKRPFQYNSPPIMTPEAQVVLDNMTEKQKMTVRDLKSIVSVLCAK